jgi:hypothetical protein
VQDVALAVVGMDIVDRDERLGQCVHRAHVLR